MSTKATILKIYFRSLNIDWDVISIELLTYVCFSYFGHWNLSKSDINKLLSYFDQI